MPLLPELLKRQWQRVEEWKRSDILSYCEEVAVARITQMDDAGKVQVKPVFKGSGAIQAIALSSDGLHMATGHTYVDHEVVTHSLAPRIHTISKLVAHPRTPLCLTFDPSPSCILYSGCLGGVVNKWNFKAGHLLSSFRTEGNRPVNSIVSLGSVLLVAEGSSLHLLCTERMEGLWTANSNAGLIRQIRYSAEERRLLVAIKQEPKQARNQLYRLQLLDFSVGQPPDLNNEVEGIISTSCRLNTPYCFATSPGLIVFCSDRLEVHKFTGGHSYIDFVPTHTVLHIDISPCEQFVLVWMKRNVLAIYNLKHPERSVIRVVDWRYTANCSLWLPLTTPHAMDICAGDTEGNLFIC